MRLSLVVAVGFVPNRIAHAVSVFKRTKPTGAPNTADMPAEVVNVTIWFVVAGSIPEFSLASTYSLM